MFSPSTTFTDKPQAGQGSTGAPSIPPRPRKAAGLLEPGEARRARARKAHECLRRRAAAFASAKGLHHLVVLPINAFAVLAFVGEQSGLLLFANGGDIDVIRRMEAHRLSAKIDLI